MFKDLIIKFLFRLLGNDVKQSYPIQQLFGVSNNHTARKRKWERALSRVWRDKDLLDYLYYQAETDKEKVFKGKVSVDLSRGARIRTLFIVFSARRAYEETIKSKRSNPTQKDEALKELKSVQDVYKELTDIA